ncbi:MAG: hypothetical protein NT001_02580, partial [Candidatus Woesearchaeota archaeon]|nr:hypothetical protein [Candidatus Woesearchaeota archaeon]
MKKSIIIIISLMMILSSLSVVAAEALMTTEPITLDPKDVTKDNIKDLSPDAVFNIPVNKLTPDVLGAMSEQQMKNLISSQLTPQVLTTISQNGKLNSDYVNIDQFTLAINKVGSMQLTKIDPNGLSNIKITAGAADTSVNLQDANGNSLRLKDSGAGTFTVDDQGVFHFEGVENLAIWHNGVRKADFTGAGSVDSDGTIVCATDTKVCSATAFEGNPISVKSPKGQVVKISGEDAVVEFGENGDIKTLKGKLEEDYLPANLRHLVLSGKEEGSHYELEASRGSLINFENGEVKNAKSDGSLLVKYDNRADTDVAAAVVHLNNGGEFSMSGSDSAEITSCSGTCSYRNRDTSKMNGFNLPESGVIEINTAKGGSLSFNAGTAVLNGKETSMMALDSKNNVLMSTTNVDAGTTKVMMGNTQVGNAADINSKTCDGKCNLVLFKSTEKGYSSDIYTQNTNKVDVFLMSDNHLNDAHVITQAGGVHGTLAITTIAKNNQNPEYIFPDLSVTQWKEQETSESTSEANTLQTSGKLAEVKIGTSTASTTISVTSTNGQISMLADRLNKNENMYKLSTTNLDGKGGEVLYSDGVNSVLLGVENPGSADQKYALKSVR